MSFDCFFVKLCDFLDSESPTFGNQMVPSEGSRGSEGESDVFLSNRVEKLLFGNRRFGVPTLALALNSSTGKDLVYLPTSGLGLLTGLSFLSLAVLHLSHRGLGSRDGRVAKLRKHR